MRAFESHDIDALVELLHEDATRSMPPYAWWLSGRAAIRQSLLAPDPYCAGSRALITRANGQPAFGQYRPSAQTPGTFDAFGLVVLSVRAGRITEETVYLDAHRLFAHFDLPLQTTFAY